MQTALRRDFYQASDSVYAAIRRERRPLPVAAPSGTNYRRWAVATCAAEARHAADDFWACVHRLGLAALFDRDDGFGGHEAPFRFAHESHAFAASAGSAICRRMKAIGMGRGQRFAGTRGTPSSGGNGSAGGDISGRASSARSNAIARRV
jgi:hypothetical protein